MNPKAEFQCIPEELQSYILASLPWQDILRCTSVCKALHQTYKSSIELQYIVELGGQQLLPVPLHSYTSTAKHLQLLRDKAQSWFKFEKCFDSFKTVFTFKRFHFPQKSVGGGHICLWDDVEDLAKILPILPKPSQQTIERDWSPRLSNSVPSAILGVFMDPAQNLIAIAYTNTYREWINETAYIDLGSLNVDGVHPQAAGPTLSPSELLGYETSAFRANTLELKVLGRHVALRRFLNTDTDTVFRYEDMWSLQIWDWKHSTTSNSVLTLPINKHNSTSIDFCFLGNDRLLVVSAELKLYSIEDISQAPQLLARFSLPISPLSICCQPPINDIPHSSEPQMQTQQTPWTSDPKHRLLCLVADMGFCCLVFVTSTNIFFNLDFFEGVEEPIPWEYWGPSNTRLFEYPPERPWRIGVSGNRVLHSFFEVGKTAEIKLRMLDFSQLAVERRQGLGRVVKQPSTIVISESGVIQNLTTSLPYVEVTTERTFGYGELQTIWIDRDRIILFKKQFSRFQRLEVMEV